MPKLIQNYQKLNYIKLGQSGGFLGRLLGPLLKTGLSLIENILKTLSKRALIPLRLTAAVSVTDAAIHKTMFGSGTATLIISNEEMNDIIKIIKSQLKMQQKNKKEYFY